MPTKSVGPSNRKTLSEKSAATKSRDEAVILGAHLRFWELGTAALDNGCNAALVIEAARAIKATGLLPRRTIRFVLFSGEEQARLARSNT